MAGWIKLEKDLLLDPRFLRLVRLYEKRRSTIDDPGPVTHDRYTRNAPAFDMLGRVCGLWCYADTHLDTDDVLHMTPNELDELVGCDGFTYMLQEASRGEWLQVLDNETCLKLPGYQSHNGMEAKARALTQKRVANHRSRGNGVALQLTEMDLERDVRNGVALPDQTRPDHTKPKSTQSAARADVLRDALNTPGLDRDAFTQWVEYRSTTKSPVRTAQLVRAAKLLASYGPVQMASVLQSMDQGWQGLFKPKTATNPQTPARGHDAVMARLEAQWSNDDDQSAADLESPRDDVRR